MGRPLASWLSGTTTVPTTLRYLSCYLYISHDIISIYHNNTPPCRVFLEPLCQKLASLAVQLQLLFSLEGVEVENWLDLNVLKLVYFSQCNCQTYTGIQFLAIPRDTLRSTGSSWRLKGSGSDPQIRIRLCTGIQFPRDPTKGNTVIIYYLSIRLNTTKSDPYSTWEICCRNKLNMHR